MMWYNGEVMFFITRLSVSQESQSGLTKLQDLGQSYSDGCPRKERRRARNRICEQVGRSAGCYVLSCRVIVHHGRTSAFDFAIEMLRRKQSSTVHRRVSIEAACNLVRDLASKLQQLLGDHRLLERPIPLSHVRLAESKFFLQMSEEIGVRPVSLKRLAKGVISTSSRAYRPHSLIKEFSLSFQVIWMSK